jgi:septal ring factor EnvC (AmiA/AmiB activator)
VPATGFQRAIGAVRRALPLVQRILPLLDGNIATAVSSILTAPQPHPLAPAPQPRVDLTPIQASITELETTHRELRDQVTEQNASLKRVEDQLEMVREATDRNTLEQQELLEDLKATGKKVNLLAVIAIGLLAISLLVNIALYLHIQRVLP